MTDPRATIVAACHASGLDLSARLRAGWYNERVAPPHRLPDFGDPESEVVLIGNSRALWPAFIGALRRDPRLLGELHPLDLFTEQVVDRARLKAGIETRVRWAHRPDPAHVSFQMLADVSGLAWPSPAALSVHPVYGPWISLRAAIVLPRPGPPEPARHVRPCRHCDWGCEVVYARTLANPSADWRSWLAVRDACPLGREHRFSQPQIRYHYTRARDVLLAEVAAD